MDTTTKYVCECGKICLSAQSFNGHKANCRQHYVVKYGNDLLWQDRVNRAVTSSTRNRLKNLSSKKESELNKWMSENHQCETCGAVMTTFYGSGRFCSKTCANTRKHSNDTRQKISASVKTSFDSNAPGLYYEHPKQCIVCGATIPYERRKSNLCGSRECLHKRISDGSKGRSGGVRPGAGYGKHGCYKGYYCDSTYELVFVIYNLDHSIEFKRNKKYYLYPTDKGISKYFPDFVMSDGSLVEIKGRITDTVMHKIASVNDTPIRLLLKDDLQYAFDYVKNTYEYKNLYDLYDS